MWKLTIKYKKKESERNEGEKYIRSAGYKKKQSITNSKLKSIIIIIILKLSISIQYK